MANNLHISYDLHEPGKNYEKVIEKIKSLGGWAKIHYSFWYLKTTQGAEQVANSIRSVMDVNDTLYVADTTNNTAYWYGLSDEVSQFIQDQWHQ